MERSQKLRLNLKVIKHIPNQTALKEGNKE